MNIFIQSYSKKEEIAQIKKDFHRSINTIKDEKLKIRLKESYNKLVNGTHNDEDLKLLLVLSFNEYERSNNILSINQDGFTVETMSFLQQTVEPPRVGEKFTCKICYKVVTDISAENPYKSVEILSKEIF